MKGELAKLVQQCEPICKCLSQNSAKNFVEHWHLGKMVCFVLLRWKLTPNATGKNLHFWSWRQQVKYDFRGHLTATLRLLLFLLLLFILLKIKSAGHSSFFVDSKNAPLWGKFYQMPTCPFPQCSSPIEWTLCDGTVILIVQSTLRHIEN